ncbi:hypothetical protein Q5P01_006918 [Channa striata]|uniref:ZP domain-containing protein n=1 Tax=Channa striata TaxID=64152 RepID=A0AA88N8X0_CHASR|nr:hypothetical protein Q5P01_006918 [Channa striata]
MYASCYDEEAEVDGTYSLRHTNEVKANVICTESTMTVEVDRSLLSGLREDHLQLSDSANAVCSLRKHSNRTHVIAVIPLNACGTEIEEDDKNLIFKNEITSTDSRRPGLITRKHKMEVKFSCQYSKKGIKTLEFTPHRRNVTVNEIGLGTFTYQFEFFPDDRFQMRFDPNSYPLKYDLGARIYMQIKATSSLNNVELFVESCTAAPYDTPNPDQTYSIITNGCKVDSTVKTYSPAHAKQFQFSMEAFKFIGLHDQVYITCAVLMCKTGNPYTRCSQGCISSGDRRRRREAVIQTANHFVSQGPLRLRGSADNIRGMMINLNVVFITGCLLAAVGTVCAVAIHRAKMSKGKYQHLPAFES